MPFLRVRGASPGDPLHEFDVAVGVVLKHPDLYVVVDSEPVAVSRPARFVPGRVPEPKTSRRVRADKPGGSDKKPAPAGDDS
jgi:hypothetical protein